MYRTHFWHFGLVASYSIYAYTNDASPAEVHGIDGEGNDEGELVRDGLHATHNAPTISQTRLNQDRIQPCPIH